MDKINQRIAAEIGCQVGQVAAAVELLAEGATVPFIARYRKEKTGGLDDTQLRKLEERLGYLRELEDRRATVLKGIEVDILEDGTLDLPDTILARLDVVVAAVHSKFDLSRVKQTERILAAMENPLVNILAHPTGRLIDKRDPYDADMAKLIRKARAVGCHLELNAHPERLDLLDTHCQMAKGEGVLVCVNSDAHSVPQYDNLRFGIGQARRGWLEREDVLNTLTLQPLRAYLAGPRAAGRQRW